MCFIIELLFSLAVINSAFCIPVSKGMVKTESGSAVQSSAKLVKETAVNTGDFAIAGSSAKDGTGDGMVLPESSLLHHIPGIDNRQKELFKPIGYEELVKPVGIHHKEHVKPAEIHQEQFAKPIESHREELDKPVGIHHKELAKPAGIHQEQFAKPIESRHEEHAKPVGINHKELAKPAGIHHKQLSQSIGHQHLSTEIHYVPVVSQSHKITAH